MTEPTNLDELAAMFQQFGVDAGEQLSLANQLPPEIQSVRSALAATSAVWLLAAAAVRRLAAREGK